MILRAPGVYVEEISSGPKPIEAVGTSTAAFLGLAPKVDAQVQLAVPVNNWTQFCRTYVGDSATSTPLAQAVYGFFENGGARCYVLNLGVGGVIASGVKDGRRSGVAVLEELPDVAIVAAPGYVDAASYDSLLGHCAAMKNRVAILDAPGEVGSKDIDRLKVVATAPIDRETNPSGGMRPAQQEGGYGAFYFPWIGTYDALNPAQLVWAPPSGCVAGVYARTDTLRGVHKAPANEQIKGALDVRYRVTAGEQADLNASGVNCIRFFPDAGIRIWGARTVADGASEWRYINVRRLFNMVEESIGRATRWVVFEPNDATLWKSIKRDIGAFLLRLWRSGALMGATPDQAFFVKCDEETNPQESIDAGEVNAEIGIAPVKPAEFVIFRIGQHAGGTTVTT